MGSLLDKIHEMEEDGTLPVFDPTSASQVLYRASTFGLKTMVMYDAMDLIREEPNLTNEEAILQCAKKWKVI
jgi:hypothetical protein